MERFGSFRGAFSYDARQWREHAIRVSRFAPCPVCGGAVAGRERAYKNGATSERAVFFEAHCMSEGCGYRYVAHEGTRDDFVAAANRRTNDETH